MQESLSPPDVRLLLLDIEGTTTPVAFVYETLFPYARRHVADFLARHRGEPPVEDDVDLLRAEHRRDREAGATPPPWPEAARAEEENEAIVAYVHWLMDRDRKSTGLKSLQGRIWKEGYQARRLRAEIYADVPVAFQRWRRQGREIAIYSSGSVEAQRLLFTYSELGDLTPSIRAYFDTRTGPKKDPRSYRLIAQALSLEPPQVLFLSDSLEELDAARSTGMKTARAVRDGPAPASAEAHPTFASFDEVFPDEP